MSTERAEFEQWAVSQGLSVTRTYQALMFANGQRRAVGDYIMIETLCAWAAWQASTDVGRYRKLQRWMASNVPEGWAEVEKLGGICAWMSMEDMDKALDALPICNVGLCEVTQ